MERKIDFYKIDYTLLPIYDPYHNNSLCETNRVFANAISCSAKSNLENRIALKEGEDSSVIIEILDITNEHLFAILGKMEDLKSGVLKKIWDKKSNTVVVPGEKDINFSIENYTYFLVRFADLTCAVLANNSAPRFRTHFHSYLKNVVNFSELHNLNIVSMIDDKINDKVNLIQNIGKIKAVFDNSSIIGNSLLKISEAFNLSQSSLIEATVDLDLKVTTISEDTRKLFKNTDALSSDFKKFEIIGGDNEDNEVQMELIERLLIKKVSIPIDDKYLKSSDDLDKIKQALVSALCTI